MVIFICFTLLICFILNSYHSASNLCNITLLKFVEIFTGRKFHKKIFASLLALRDALRVASERVLRNQL